MKGKQSDVKESTLSAGESAHEAILWQHGLPRFAGATPRFVATSDLWPPFFVACKSASMTSEPWSEQAGLP